MKEFIEKISRIKANNYISDPDSLDSHFNGEKRITDDYKGRELFELLQNADDELQPANNKEIKIVFNNNYLSVYNNGRPFSKEGVKSLMYSDLSPKRKNNLLEIGCKGLGFRSILGWVNEIEIDSAELHIKFSQDIALEQLKKYQGSDYIRGKRPPTLEFPMWNDDYEQCDYTTRIKLQIKNDNRIIKDINKQLESLDAELLLFLNQATKLSIITEKGSKEFEKKYLDNKKEHLILSEKVNGKLKSENKWVVVSKEGKCKETDNSGKEVDRKYRVSIACKEDGTKPKNKYIYSYFPTSMQFDHPFLIHATFDLNSSRNNLIEKEANQIIVKAIAETMVKLAEKMYPRSVNYDRLWILISNWGFPDDLKRNNIEEYLIGAIKKTKIFPNVNGKFISEKEEPINLNEKTYLAQNVKGKDFDNLLMYYNLDILRKNLSNFDVGSYYTFNRVMTSFGFSDEYEINKLKKAINEFVSKFKYCKKDMEKLADIAFSLYELEIDNKFFNLLFDDKKKLANCNKVHFTKTNTKMTEPPEFVNFDFIDERYLEIIEEYYDSDFEQWLSINDAGFISIVETACDIINKKSEKNNEIAKEYIAKMIGWLWNNRKILYETKRTIPIKMITRNGAIEDANTLYYGKEYGNYLIDNLLRTVKNDIYVCDIRQFITGKELKNKDLIDFLKFFDVAGLPIKYYEYIDSAKMDYKLEEEYLKLIAESSKISFPYNIPGSHATIENIDSFCQSTSVMMPSTTIDFIDDILSKAPTESIIEWIDKDEELKELLIDKKPDKAINHMPAQYLKYGIRSSSMTNYREEGRLKNSLSYVYFLFNNSAWVSVKKNGDNRRIKANNCILNSEYDETFAPFLYGVDIDDLISKDKKEKKKRIKDILIKLGIVDRVDKLPFEKIYTLLKILEEKDPEGKFVPAIYNCIANSEKRFDPLKLSNIKEYISYINHGTVLTNNGFKPVKESFYQANYGLCNQIRNKYNIIKLQKKLGYESIKTKFGVEQLSIKGKLEQDPIEHPFSYEFQEEFRKFKTYAYCYRIDQIEDDDRIRSYCNLKINLCLKIIVNYNGEIVELKDFEYFDKRGTYYIKVPEKFNENSFNHSIDFCKIVADIVSASLYNSLNKSADMHILFSMSDKERKEKVLEDNSDPNIIARSKQALNYIGSTKDEFIRILSKVSKEPYENYKAYIERIDFEELTSNKNCPVIVDCFKSAKIDINDYNKQNPDLELSLKNYYIDQIEKKKEEYRLRYQTAVFNKLQNASIKEKEEFRESLVLFENTKIEVQNSVFFDVDSAIKMAFNINSDDEIDIDKIYFDNCEKWKETQPNKELIDEFLNMPKPHSLLYFAEYEELNRRYETYIDSKKVEDEEKQFIPEKKTAIFKQYDIEASENNDQSTQYLPKSVGYSHRSNKAAEKTGQSGERIVYDKLKEEGHDVVWVSENALREGVNAEGQAGKGFDMYIKEGGKTTYIEVKASKKDDISFIMSDREYEFAKKHHKDFVIYYVTNLDSNSPEILKLDNLFGKDGIKGEGKRVNVKRDTQYIITAKRKEKKT